MATQWTHTRKALLQFPPATAAKYLPQLLFKGPGILAHARGLMTQYSLNDDRFKIYMIHHLRQTFPGDLEPLYEALLQDIMADKPQLT